MPQFSQFPGTVEAVNEVANQGERGQPKDDYHNPNRYRKEPSQAPEYAASGDQQAQVYGNRLARLVSMFLEFLDFLVSGHVRRCAAAFCFRGGHFFASAFTYSSLGAAW